MSAAPVTYDPKFFEVLTTLEDEHFWFRTRNDLIVELAAQVLSAGRPGARLLEVGCGNGNVLRHLASVKAGSTVVGMDLYPEGLEIARRRTRSPLVAADIYHAPFRRSFDLVGIFDVLEHLPDDRSILRSLHSLLLPGGALLITVPASPALWSYFDVSAHHCRRYTVGDLGQKLDEAGFQVEFLSYFMSSIYPLVYAGRKLSGLRRRAPEELTNSELTVVPGFNSLLTRILRWENRHLAQRHPLPFGASLVAIARAR